REETGADGVEVYIAVSDAAAIGLHGHHIGPVAAGEQCKSGNGGGTGDGQGADLLVKAADQARGVDAGIAILQRSDSEGEETGRIEAGALGEQSGERTQE